MVDQVTTKFRELTYVLIDIRNRTAHLLAECPDDVQTVHALQGELFDTLDQALPLNGEGGADHPFSYIMYLIDIIATYRGREITLGRLFNTIGMNLNAAADLIGMKQVGDDDQDTDRQAP